MVVLWIILGILLFIILALYILLHISVCADIDANTKRIKINVTYLWFKLWSMDSSAEKTDEPDEPKSEEVSPRKPEIELVELTDEPLQSVNEESNNESDPSESEDKPSDDEDSQDEKEPFFDKAKRMIEEYKPFVPVANKGLKKLFKLIRFYDLDLSVTVGDGDAYKAAMKFGQANALIYSILGLLCCAFSVRIKNTSVNCDFNSKTVDGAIKTTVKVRPSALLSLIIYLGINYLLIKHKQKKVNKETNLEKESNNNEREEQKP